MARARTRSPTPVPWLPDCGGLRKAQIFDREVTLGWAPLTASLGCDVGLDDRSARPFLGLDHRIGSATAAVTFFTCKGRRMSELFGPDALIARLQQRWQWLAYVDVAIIELAVLEPPARQAHPGAAG
jgi:hypothetical protein